MDHHHHRHRLSSSGAPLMPRRPRLSRRFFVLASLLIGITFLLYRSSFSHTDSFRQWVPETLRHDPLQSVGLSEEEAGKARPLLSLDRLGKPTTTAAATASNKPTSAPNSKPTTSSPASGHERLSNGLLVRNPRGRHPILDLIEEGERKWKEMHKRQSGTLLEAVKEYQRRYGKRPPEGFDKWWEFVQTHKVKLPDEYDQIDRDISPLLALPPGALAKRVSWVQNEIDSITFLFTIGRGGSVKVSGGAMSSQTGRERASAQLALIEGFKKYLAEGIKIPFNIDDAPKVFLGWQNKELLSQVAHSNDFLSEDEYLDDGRVGWNRTCKPTDPMNTGDVSRPTKEPSFIYDHFLSFDFCYHPNMTLQHGFTSWTGPAPQRITPLFSHCKARPMSDVLITPTEQWGVDVGNDPPWEQKTDGPGRVLWRGQSTGVSYTKSRPWHDSQRARLVRMQNPVHHDPLSVLFPTGPYPYNSPLGWALTTADPKVLADRYLDVAFSGDAVQCSREDGTCDQMMEEFEFVTPMSVDESNRRKFEIDVDGNGWSGRFHRLMSTRSCVLKSTMFPEWYWGRIMPWVHFVPIKVDYSDLFDVMAFFTGDLDGNYGHDELAKKIGENGQRWAQEYWRFEDMQAYMFRLYLEYGRAYASDRESMDFVYDDKLHGHL